MCIYMPDDLKKVVPSGRRTHRGVVRTNPPSECMQVTILDTLSDLNLSLCISIYPSSLDEPRKTSMHVNSMQRRQNR